MLLITEKEDEFAEMVRGFVEDIGPEGVIEGRYVEDIAYYTWEILRYRRSKAGIINAAMSPALHGILAMLLPKENFTFITERETDSERLARGWFEKSATKKEVMKTLQTFGLDETDVVAEAFRLRADDIATCDRLEALAEARREKALRFIGTMRKKLGERLRQRSDNMLAKEEVATLVPVQPEAN
jgi:hypothetical protein